MLSGALAFCCLSSLQMAEALGSKSIGSFVALVSVWNFLGRMGAG